MTGLGLGFTNCGECGICVLVAVVLVESGWAAWAKVWKGGVVLCLCVL